MNCSELQSLLHRRLNNFDLVFRGKSKQSMNRHLFMGEIMKVFKLLLLITCATVIAFGQSKISQQVATDSPPFKLEITASRQVANSMLLDFVNSAGQTVEVNDVVELAIRKTNISDYQIDRTTHVGSVYGYRIEVLDSNGNLVGPGKLSDAYHLKGNKPPHLSNVLQPGECVIDTYPLSVLFDMSKPGIYAVQVSAYIMNDAELPVVKSNIIKITVVPPDPPAEEPK